MLRHLQPPGWRTRGFDRWICGEIAFSHELGTNDLARATCAACVERRKVMISKMKVADQQHDS